MSGPMFPYGGPNLPENVKTITCPCGETVELTDSFTNICDECDQHFDGKGNTIRPASEWEEPWDED